MGVVRFFYDCEFIELGPYHPISLSSIGIVREDGQSLYLVNKDAPWDEIGNHPWLMENVVPSLPVSLVRQSDDLDVEMARAYWSIVWQADAPVYAREDIANAVREFCVPPEHARRIAGPTEMWGWYADYDHVILSQLFGRMIDLPKGMPMYTRDLKQEVDLWCEEYPHQKGAVQDALAKADARCPGTEHNALEDALQLKARYEEFARYRSAVKFGRVK